jgi:hypothetical protein
MDLSYSCSANSEMVAVNEARAYKDKHKQALDLATVTESPIA